MGVERLLLMRTGTSRGSDSGLAVRRLLADADLRERYGAAARARIARDFSIAGEGDAINGVYRRIWEAT